jgi:hypothetical protein
VWSLTTDTEGNIYAGGWIGSNLSNFDYGVVSLNNEGEERWIFTKPGGINGTGIVDKVVFDGDSSVISVGMSHGEIGIEFAVYSFSTSTPVIIDELLPGTEASADFILNQCRPNPVTGGQATISFTVLTAGRYDLVLRNILGQHLASILNEHYLPGSYQLPLNLQGLPGGLYYLTMSNGVESLTNKIVIR